MKDNFTSAAPVKSKAVLRAALIALMILLMSTVFWLRTNQYYLNDSESLVVGMLAAQKHNVPIAGRSYGLGQLYPVGTMGDYSNFVDETYDAYYHGLRDVPYEHDSYIHQIGLQGWAFYALGAVVPHALSALRLSCCVALAAVISAICIALSRRYGLLFAVCFYVVTLVSSWVTNFAPNLYWIPFTWYLPLLLGITCVNHPTRRALLIPLFAFAVFLKSACGYEFLTAILLGAVLFPAMEWVFSIRSDKGLARRWFFTTLWIGVSCLVGFFAAFSVHALIRGSGNWLGGVQDIIANDAMRRTFADASAYAAEFAPSLNASVLQVLGLYFSPTVKSTTAQTMFWLAISNLLLLSANSVLWRKIPWKDAALLLAGWLVSVSWFIFAKAHSFDHPYMNPVLWYLAFAQISVFILVRQAMLLIRQPRLNRSVKSVLDRIQRDAYAEL